MQEQIVIFGASGGGIKVAQTLLSLGIDLSFFVDNDKKKWGKELEGRPICSPESLLENKNAYRIIIASEYQKEIEAQLEVLGVADKQTDKETYIISYVLEHLSEYKYLLNEKYTRTRKQRILIDLLEGMKLGGIEEWSYTVAKGLSERGEEVKVLSTSTGEKLPEHLKSKIVTDVDASYEDYKGTIDRLVTLIAENLPCAILINKQTQALYAGFIVKHYYPEQVRLVSVIHNDNIAYYRRQAALIDYVDAVACVSNDIRKRFINEFNMPKEKFFYKESAVDYDQEFSKEYTINRDEPIQIGFASRIEKVQKRADLLPVLIQELQKREINYCLSIAGDGSYFPRIEEFINEYGAAERVHLLGRLDKESMKELWKKQDVFISVSEYEGQALSMLEAMSYGLVPVSTRVASVDEFIEHGENGFICEQGNVAQMAEYIMRLEQSRELLEEYGLKSREKIKKKCNRQEYMDYIISLCGLIE